MSITDRLWYEFSSLGERFGIDALTYNPVIFRMYDRLAEADAPIIMERLQTVVPEAERVLDVGAGSGRFAAEARRRGLDVTAIERSD